MHTTVKEPTVRNDEHAWRQLEAAKTAHPAFAQSSQCPSTRDVMLAQLLADRKAAQAAARRRRRWLLAMLLLGALAGGVAWAWHSGLAEQAWTSVTGAAMDAIDDADTVPVEPEPGTRALPRPYPAWIVAAEHDPATNTVVFTVNGSMWNSAGELARAQAEQNWTWYAHQHAPGATWAAQANDGTLLAISQ